MATVRSPNYPNIPLSTALEAVRPAFKGEGRNKMSKLVLAKHLGYNSLNGRALGKIGAVRAYGLIEGASDELRLSDDAITALMAPNPSEDRSAALARLAVRPSLFQELRKDFPTSLPSAENLKYNLIKRHFTPDGAEKAARVYLATMNLVAGISSAYDAPGDEDDGAEDGAAPPQVQNPVSPLPTPAAVPGKAKIMAGERELTTGILSKEANFRVLVSGPVGVKEIERLIAKLTFDKEILAEPDEFDDLIG